MINIKKTPLTVAAKLIVAVSALMCVVGVIFSLLFYRYEKSILLSDLAEHGSFASDLVLRGVHYGMLTAQRNVIQFNVDKLGSSEDISEVTIFNRDGTVFASSDHGKIGTRIEPTDLVKRALDGISEKPWLTQDATGSTVLKQVTPIFNEQTCSTAECHFHSGGEHVLGALQTTLTAHSVLASSRKMLAGTFIFGLIFMAATSLALFFILYKLVTKPLGIMEQGMRRLAKGDFEHPIEIRTGDEMEFLADVFNTMSRSIKDYKVMLEDWTDKLQDEVERKTKEIREAHEHLIDAEKLASLGRLAAGVAHELNSPLTGILSYAHLMRKRTPQENAQDIEDLNVIIEQTERCATIIKGLLGFARKGSSGRTKVEVNEIINSSIAIVKNQSKFHNVELKLELQEGLPPVTANPNQLQQVFLNMLTNAADAMENAGSISISSRELRSNGSSFVEVEFSDTGPGIPQEQQGRIFEPFFTTKPVGEGTGLGLSVSYGIVKRHGGNITLRSVPGKGAAFRITLPAYNEKTQGEGNNLKGGCPDGNGQG